MKSLENKVIWITGASSGIGREMALQCSRLGAQVVLSSRRKEVLEQIRQELAAPEKAMVLPLDMEQSLVFHEKVKQVMDRFGRIDLLFNNAGITHRSEIHETPLDLDRKLMEVNYFGTVGLTKAVLPVMRQQQSGHMAVLSSMAGKTGFFQRSAYSAAKHALIGFFESLRFEEDQNNLKVTIFCPGPVRTRISVNALNSSGEKHGIVDKVLEQGLPVEQCVRKMIRAIERDELEVLISKGPESMAMRLKAVFPDIYFKALKKRLAKMARDYGYAKE